MPVFECHQCGKCCNFSNYPLKKKSFSIWEWEKVYLEKIAALNEIQVEIRPRCGVLRGDKLLVWQYILIQRGKCPFLNSEGLCMIHGRKPLMCALSPYPDEILSDKETWGCFYEDDHDYHPKRKPFYKNPLEYLPNMMALTALLVRTFNMYGPIEGKCRLMIIPEKRDDLIKKGIKKLKIKNLYSELTRLGLLSPVFLEQMNKYSFANLISVKKVIDEINEKVPYTQIDEEKVDGIFKHWDESPYEIYTLKEDAEKIP